MNWRRGLIRVWIVAGAAWLVGWLGYVGATCTTPTLPPNLGGETVTLCHTHLFDGGWANQVRNFTFWDYASIAWTGLAPLAALVGVSLGWVAARWTAQGFQRR